MAQSGAAAAVGGALGLETSKPRVAEDDAAFIAEKDRVLRLEQELAIASQKAERVLLQEEKYGDALGELGLECIKLGKLEDEEANRAGHYTEAGAASRTMATQSRTMGNAVVRISRLTRAATGQLARALDPLHDYLGMMPAVRKAVADRSETLLTLQTSLAEVDGKKARIAKLETDITKMLRVDQLKRELAETQATSEAAAREYAHIKERHGEEFARLEASRSATFKDMWLGFARTQVAHAESVRSASGAPSRKISARARTSGSTRTRERGRGSIRRRREGRLRRTAARREIDECLPRRGGSHPVFFFCKTRDNATRYTIRPLASTPRGAYTPAR